MVDKPLEDIQHMLDLNKQETSLDTPITGDTDNLFVDMIPDEQTVDPVDILQGENLHELMERWLDLLSCKQQEVLVRRFGLRGHDRSTLEEVGEAVGLTRERVRQIQIEGLKRLRAIMEEQGIHLELAGVALGYSFAAWLALLRATKQKGAPNQPC